MRFYKQQITTVPDPDAFRAAREAAEISVRDLATRCGIRESVVRCIELGTAPPNGTRFLQMIKGLEALIEERSKK